MWNATGCQNWKCGIIIFTQYFKYKTRELVKYLFIPLFVNGTIFNSKTKSCQESVIDANLNIFMKINIVLCSVLQMFQSTTQSFPIPRKILNNQKANHKNVIFKRYDILVVRILRIKVVVSFLRHRKINCSYRQNVRAKLWFTSKTKIVTKMYSKKQ